VPPERVYIYSARAVYTARRDGLVPRAHIYSAANYPYINAHNKYVVVVVVVVVHGERNRIPKSVTIIYFYATTYNTRTFAYSCIYGVHAVIQSRGKYRVTANPDRIHRGNSGNSTVSDGVSGRRNRNARHAEMGS